MQVETRSCRSVGHCSDLEVRTFAEIIFVFLLKTLVGLSRSYLRKHLNTNKKATYYVKDFQLQTKVFSKWLFKYYKKNVSVRFKNR